MSTPAVLHLSDTAEWMPWDTSHVTTVLPSDTVGTHGSRLSARNAGHQEDALWSAWWPKVHYSSQQYPMKVDWAAQRRDCNTAAATQLGEKHLDSFVRFHKKIDGYLLDSQLRCSRAALGERNAGAHRVVGVLQAASIAPHHLANFQGGRRHQTNSVAAERKAAMGCRETHTVTSAANL